MAFSFVLVRSIFGRTTVPCKIVGVSHNKSQYGLGRKRKARAGAQYLRLPTTLETMRTKRGSQETRNFILLETRSSRGLLGAVSAMTAWMPVQWVLEILLQVMTARRKRKCNGHVHRRIIATFKMIKQHAEGFMATLSVGLSFARAQGVAMGLAKGISAFSQACASRDLSLSPYCRQITLDLMALSLFADRRPIHL